MSCLSIHWIGRRTVDGAERMWGCGHFDGAPYAFWFVDEEWRIKRFDSYSANRRFRSFGPATFDTKVAEKTQKGYISVRKTKRLKDDVESAFGICLLVGAVHRGRRGAA